MTLFGSAMGDIDNLLRNHRLFCTLNYSCVSIIKKTVFTHLCAGKRHSTGINLESSLLLALYADGFPAGKQHYSKPGNIKLTKKSAIN